MNKRTIYVVLLVLALAALNACGGSGRITAVVMAIGDTGSLGSANRLTVSLKNSTGSAVFPTYLVAWSSRTQFLWRCVNGCGPVANQEQRAITLQAPDYAAAVPNGAVGAVRIVDARSAEEYESKHFAVAFVPLHMRNPCLCAPEDAGYVVPAGWKLRLADVAAGLVSYATDGRRGRLTLHVPRSAAPGWSYTSVYQPFVPFDHPIWAEVSKSVLYDGGDSPSHYAGISVADDTGHFVVFTWGDVDVTTVRVHKGIFVVEPAATTGKLLRIDFARYARQAGFSPQSSYALRLVVAGRSPSTELATTFSGFHVGATANRLQ